MIKPAELAAVLALLSPATACRTGACSGEFDFDAEAVRVHDIALLMGANTVATISAKDGPSSHIREWTVNVGDTWPTYKASLSRALTPTYRCEDSTQTRTKCTRQLPGDVLGLDIASERQQTETIAHFSFEIRPY